MRMFCSIHSPALLSRLEHACSRLLSPEDQVPESHCGERNGPHPQTAASFDLPLVPRSPHRKAAYLGSDSEPAQCKMSFPWGRWLKQYCLSKHKAFIYLQTTLVQYSIEFLIGQSEYKLMRGPKILSQLKVKPWTSLAAQW